MKMALLLSDVEGTVDLPTQDEINQPTGAEELFARSKPVTPAEG